MLKPYHFIVLLSVCISPVVMTMDRSLFHVEDPDIDQLYPRQEEVVEEAQPMLRIFNRTPHKIVVCLQFEEEQPGTLTLIEEQGITLPYDKPLKLFKVAAYGRYRKWLNTQELLLGWYKLPNKAAKVCEKFTQTKKRVKVIIDLGAALMGEGFLRRIAGEFVPYRYIYEGFTPRFEQDFKKQECMVDIFPQVKYARGRGLEVLPRYVLCVPEGATNNDYDFAFRVFAWYWTRGEVSQSLHESVSSMPIELLREAFQALRSGDDKAFREAVDKCSSIYMSSVEASL